MDLRCALALVVSTYRGGLNVGTVREECASAGTGEDVRSSLSLKTVVGLVAWSSSSNTSLWIDAASDDNKDFCLVVGLFRLDLEEDSGLSNGSVSSIDGTCSFHWTNFSFFLLER